MFRRKKQQARVEVSFLHGIPALPKHIIDVLSGQEFIQSIGADGLWEGSTLIKEYQWIAGYTIVYDYFYR